MNNYFRTGLIVCILLLGTSLFTNSIANFFAGIPIIPAVHPVAAVPDQNVLGFNCAYGTINPVTRVITTARDTASPKIDTKCEWAGDTDSDSRVAPIAPFESGMDPLASDPAPRLPEQLCSMAPCNHPGGGGWIVDVMLANSNITINAFDITVLYDTKVLSLVENDQRGLLFGGNVGCDPAYPNCTLPLAFKADPVKGSVRIAQAIINTLVGGGGANVELFRLRFDVVGAGTGQLTIVNDKIVFAVGTSTGPEPHTHVDLSFSTNFIFNFINNTPQGTATCNPCGLGFNASWTFSPNPIVPGSPLTLSAVAACSNCTAPFSYFWDFNSTELHGYVLRAQATGSTVSITTPPTFVTRVTLVVKDSSTPVPYNVTVTRRLPLAVSIVTPSTVPVGAPQSWTGTWFGGLPSYSGVWTFCPDPAICAVPQRTITATSTLQSDTLPSEFFSFAGLYPVTLIITDSLPVRLGGPTTITQTFYVNVTGAPSAFTVTLTPGASQPPGQPVQFTATAAYSGSYPPSLKSDVFKYTFLFGDGTSQTIPFAGTSVSVSHAYGSSGTFPVRVLVKEANPSSSQIQESASSSYVASQLLIADFTFGPNTPTVGQSTTFTAAVSGGTGPFTYSWNFSEVPVGTGASTTHTFATAKTYNVTLTVTDSSGSTVTKSHIITVTSAPQVESLPIVYIIGGGVAAGVAAVVASLFLVRRRKPTAPATPAT